MAFVRVPEVARAYANQLMDTNLTVTTAFSRDKQPPVCVTANDAGGCGPTARSRESPRSTSSGAHRAPRVVAGGRRSDTHVGFAIDGLVVIVANAAGADLPSIGALLETRAHHGRRVLVGATVTAVGCSPS